MTGFSRERQPTKSATSGGGSSLVLTFKIKSLEEDKRLKIEMSADTYEFLARCGINFDDFSKGEKLFDEDREKFMDYMKRMGAKAEIVDKDFVYKSLFGK